MKTGFRHWPLLLALVLGLAVFFAYRARSQPELPTARPRPESPETPSAPTPAPAGQDPAPNPGPGPAAAPKVEKVPPGSLRVTITGTSFEGRLVVVDADNTSESIQAVSGEGSAEHVIPKLKPGAKTVVFIPGETHLAASTEAVVVSAQEARAALTLKDAASLKGVVVDSLQQPLPEARIEVSIAGVLPARPGTPGPNSLWSEAGGRSSGPRGSRVSINFSQQLGWDGALKKSITTDGRGGFELTGVAGPAVTVEISYKNVRFTQSCAVDAENLLIVPVVREAPARNLEAEELRRSTTEILRQMVLHPEASEAYAAQLRDILSKNLEKSSATPKEKEEIRKHIDAIGRPAPPRNP